MPKRLEFQMDFQRGKTHLGKIDTGSYYFILDVSILDSKRGSRVVQEDLFYNYMVWS
jgi:hypothetical protein